VGLITVDRTGLVVAANRRANAMIGSAGSDLIGISAQASLPLPICELVRVAQGRAVGEVGGRLDLNQRTFQCRISPLETADGRRGSIVALWEDVK
jgi:PAS domain-containing protein